jgi:protein-disulfide isomerase
MTRNLKLTVGLLAAAAVATAIVVLAARGDEPNTTPAQAQPGAGTAAGTRDGTAPPLVRPDSHKLSAAADGKVTVVEFLDFECEACGAAYPHVEELRQRYGDKITFVVRYFPIASHPNAERAARTVEAAAAQGKFAEMYTKLFTTQQLWGHQQAPQDQVFRGFATDLGLDLAAYDRKLADPATAARVKQDQQDGITAGVQGTPTFYVNGQQVQARTLGELVTNLQGQIDAALAG